jgi:hypothetical protein
MEEVAAAVSINGASAIGKAYAFATGNVNAGNGGGTALSKEEGNGAEVK